MDPLDRPVAGNQIFAPPPAIGGFGGGGGGAVLRDALEPPDVASGERVPGQVTAVQVVRT